MALSLTPDERKNLLDKAKDFFFEAMLAGWVSDNDVIQKPETTIPNMSGIHTYEYEKGNFRLVDSYYSQGEKSCGTTMIWYRGEPIWFMAYHGWYKPEAITTLKFALRDNYKEKVFEGGRGPGLFINSLLIYSNKQDPIFPLDESFELFRGQEQIRRSVQEGPPILLGTHSYAGQALI